MELQIARSLVVDSANVDGGVVYSPAVETGGQTGVRLTISALSAGAAISLRAEIQQSVDLVNWSAGLFTTSTITVAPATAAAETTTAATMPLAGHVRIKFTNTANSVVVGASLNFFDFNL